MRRLNGVTTKRLEAYRRKEISPGDMHLAMLARGFQLMEIASPYHSTLTLAEDVCSASADLP